MQLTVNSKRYDLDVEPEMPLLWVLRGVKCGELVNRRSRRWRPLSPMRSLLSPGSGYANCL